MTWQRDPASKKHKRYLSELMRVLKIEHQLPADLRKVEALYLVNHFERRIMGLSPRNKAIRKPVLKLVGGRDA